MTHLDLQHRLYLREEGFYKDFAIKTQLNSEIGGAVKKDWKNWVTKLKTLRSCMSENL